MKKFVSILLATVFALALLWSCSSAQDCPAYSDASDAPVEVEDVA